MSGGVLANLPDHVLPQHRPPTLRLSPSTLLRLLCNCKYCVSPSRMLLVGTEEVPGADSKLGNVLTGGAVLREVN